MNIESRKRDLPPGARRGQGSEIELASGRYLDLALPDPALIGIGDLAHHLAQCNRYAGACVRPFSVAEHTILVSRRLEGLGESWETCLLGLHHDNPEAFIHDITRPTKEMIGKLYRPIEDRLEKIIHGAIGLPAMAVEQAEAIKDADNWALAKEAHVLLPSEGKGWWCEGLYDPDADDENTVDLAIPDAEQSFVAVREAWKRRHRQLSRRVRA